VRPLTATVALLIAAFAPASGVDTCITPSLVPGYAHNDYRNRRPLLDALELGFRGVEADVFRVGTQLLVGHDRRALRPGYTLSRLYLDRLRERYHRCGRVLADGAPFFLNVELKEADTTAFRYLLDALRRYDELFQGSAPGARPAVRVTLVGWWPIGNTLAWPDYLRVQRVIERDRAAGGSTDRPVGLVSIDYGKVLSWRGRGDVPTADKQTLARAWDLSAKLGVPLRVHHAPPDSRVYKWLVLENVSLIGTTDLKRTRILLTQIIGQPSNMRLKLPAPSLQGRIAFVFTESVRRSLGAIR
jgi:hypothetical protein